MIVISSGLRKAGSGLYFNLTNDLLIASGKEDIRKIRGKYNLHDILKYHNCNMEILSEENLKRLLSIHEAGYTFVVKTHRAPSKYALELIKRGIVKVTCIFRDPRDVTLSAIDHGEKIRNQGNNHTFASCISIENTIPQVKSWLDNGIMKWLELEDLLMVKYEDLVTNPTGELKRLAGFLGIEGDAIDFEAIYSRYRHAELDDFQRDYLHFNVGIPGRFRTVLKKKDLDLCSEGFSQYLEKMGYNKSKDQPHKNE